MKKIETVNLYLLPRISLLGAKIARPASSYSLFNSAALISTANGTHVQMNASIISPKILHNWLKFAKFFEQRETLECLTGIWFI